MAEDKRIDEVTGTATSGHEWDGIEELDTPMPRWWLWSLYATIIWGIVYVILYPAWPMSRSATDGTIGWSSRGQLEKELAAEAQRRAPIVNAIAATPIAELPARPQLMQAAIQASTEAMQSAVPAGEGAMAAVLGLEDADIVAACAEAAQGEVVEAVNFNAPGQVVIAGGKAAVERAIAACKARGAKRAMPLPVSVPSHCALMKPAAERLAEALESVSINVPVLPVLHNADVAAYSEAAQIRDALVRQLYSPVRWTETIRKLAADGVLLHAECGPGKVLAGLNKRIESTLSTSALTDDAAIAAVLTSLA